MSLNHLKELLGNSSITMNNQSVRMNLNNDGREKTKVKVNGTLRGQCLCMQMKKRMCHRKRSLMQLDKDMSCSSRIEVWVMVSWSVQHVPRRPLSDIIHRIMVVGLKYTMHRRRRDVC